MTQTQTPYPPHSRRSPQVWAAARADFEGGASLRIVAERHGLNIRTASRHARAEGWRAPRVDPAELYGLAAAKRGFDPAAFNEMAAVDHVADRDDEALLLRPDSLGLCRFAFRRAAECASVSGPTEAMAWIRLAQSAARLRRMVDIDVRPMSEADYRRVAALSRLESDATLDAFECAPPDDGSIPEVSETVP
jgi:hypothetical protein